MRKRTISLLLIIMIVLTLLPYEASATLSGEETIVTTGKRYDIAFFLWTLAGKPEVDAPNIYSDVTKEQSPAVSWAYSNGIMGGTSSTKFSPNTTSTRAQVVTFLYRFIEQQNLYKGVTPSTREEPFPFTDIHSSVYYYDAVRWAWQSGFVSFKDGETLFHPNEKVDTLVYDGKTGFFHLDQPNPFSDVSYGQYFYEPVLWAVNHNPQITNGTSANIFSPAATCTRGQIVTFLWRASGCPEPASGYNPFQDIKVNEYYVKAVLWAVEQGITTGTDKTHFSPDANCTRAQAVTFLWRAAGKPAAVLSVCDDPIVYITASGNGTAYHRSTCSTLQHSTIVGIPLSEALARGYTPCKRCKPDSAPSTPDPTPTPAPTPTPTPHRDTVGGFSDVFADQYFADAVLWAVSKGITNGIDAAHFGPDNPCTRGQIVTFLYRDMK